jgi:4-amino-4-deoxy-L-arabinose transferase-like glycosyltransferase
MNRSLVRALAASVLFLVLSALLIPFAGIQDDEVLFTTPVYSHIGKEFRVRILHHDVFLMVISYIGALKTMLFAPIFWLFGTNRWSLRLPVALIGAGTVFVFYLLAERSAGRWAALLVAFLLATDPVFLLTNTVDWGPVAIEHVLLVIAAWSLLRFAQSPGADEVEAERKYLILGFVCIGLALWNKAIFVWALTGMTVAALGVFPDAIRRLTKRRNLRIAGVALLAGALPLVVYNLRHKNATLRENARLDPGGPISKWIQVKNALNGSSLFVYMVSEEWMPQPKPAAATRVGQAAIWLREHWGEHRQTGFYYVLGLLLVAVPLWWRSRAARFSLVFCAVTWLAMALTRDAGGSAHHVVLLWPFPLLFAGVALSRLAEYRAGRWLATALAVALVAMNLVVLNQYLVQFDRNGPAEIFTDAVYPLSDRLAAFPGRPIYVIDWGMLNVLTFLHQGRLDLEDGSAPLTAADSNGLQQKILRVMITNPAAVFVDHIAGEEIFPHVNDRLDQAAQGLGYRKELLESVADSNGRPRFEIFQFLPAGG